MHSRRQKIYEESIESLEEKLANLYETYYNSAGGAKKWEVDREIKSTEKEIFEIEQKLEALKSRDRSLEEVDDEVDDIASVQWNDELRKKYLENFIKRHQEIRQQDAAYFYVEQDLATKDPRPPSKIENDPEKIRQQDPRSLYPESIPSAELIKEIVEARRGRNWLILGEAGIGKTTFLERVGMEFAHRALQDTNKPMPVFIRFAEYASYIQQVQQQESRISAITLLSRYIASCLKDSINTSIAVNEIIDGLENAKYLLLLDALDEVGRPDQRDRVLQNIKDVLNKNSVRSSIITTTRTASYYDFTSFRPLNQSTRTLLPFSKKQREEYIRKQLGEEAPLHASRLYKALEDSRFQYLLSRPFLIWLMVRWLIQQPEESSTLIPDSRLKLYDNFVTSLIKERVEKLIDHEGDQLATDALAEQIRQYLRSIAHRLHTSREQYIPETDLKECLQQITPGITDKQIELYFVPHAGLLQKVQDSYYAFSHFIFQEYFVAEYYKEHDGEEEREELVAYSMDAWWDEVLVIYNAFYTDNWLLQRLMAERDTIFATRLLLAVQCFKVLSWNIHKETPRIREQVYERLCEKYYECCYPPLQELLFQSIQSFDDNLFLEFLKDQLKRFEEQYRRKAIEALGQLGVRSIDHTSSSTIELRELEKLMDTVYNGPYRLEVIKALIILDTRKDQQTILRWLSGGEQPRPDAPKIVRELIQAERQDYIHILLNIVFDLRIPPWIRQTIFAQLGKVHVDLIKQQFQEVLKSSLEEKNTFHVLELLRAIYFPVDNEIKSIVLSFLSSSSNDASFLKAAVFFLGNQAICTPYQPSTDDVVIEQLFHLLFESNSTELSYEEQEDFYGEILSTFVKFNTHDTLDFVANHLQTSPSDTKWDKVITTAGEVGGEESLNFLINQLDASLEDGMTPSDRTTKMICSLHQIVLRLHQEVKRPTVELSQPFCQKLLRHLVKSSEASEVVEAVVYLLLSYATHALRTELFDFVITGQHSEIGKEIAHYFLMYDQQIESIQLKNYYVRHRHRDHIYRLLIRTLPDKELRSYLRQDLASRDKTICSITLHEMYLEIAKLDLNKDRELLKILYDLLSSSHGEIVEKTMILLGEFSKDKDVLARIVPFLKGTEHDLAFGVLFELAKRNFWFGDKAFLEEHHGKVISA